MRSPALYSFLSGLSAAVGTNLITAIVGADSRRLQIDLVISALPWIGLSASLAVIASLLERVQRETDLKDSPNLSKEERRELAQGQFRKIRHIYKKWLIISTFILAGALGGVAVLVDGGGYDKIMWRLMSGVCGP